tara:strand:- start:59 stop:646 length:588 start_codon:yes stop_codon:yes gene_type:complete
MNDIFPLVIMTAITAIFIYFLNKSDKKDLDERIALERHKKAKAEEEKAKEEKRAKEAKRIAELKLARLRKYDKALTFSTYELAEVVINLVDCINYDKLKEVASVLSDQMHVDEVLVEASKKLSSGYESAIKEISGTRCIDIDYSEKEVVAKLESLVDSCIAIGTGAIGKKIGLSAGSTGSSTSKGEIRKTKKWKD